MKTWTTPVALAAAALALAVAAPAGAATQAQYGAKCNAAWSGKRGTKAFRTYKRHCVAAAVAAARAARSAGNNDDAIANRGRARTACTAQFPAPRRSRVRRTAFRACVTAAIAAEKAYGGRPLHAALAGGGSSDPNGAGAATLTLNQGHGQICYAVSWTGLATVTGVTVRALADDSLAVALDADANLADGSANGCVNGLSKDLIKAIRQHPERYTVSVATDEFPTGAIQGTLSK
jgi:hypothetical protein